MKIYNILPDTLLNSTTVTTLVFMPMVYSVLLSFFQEFKFAMLFAPFMSVCSKHAHYYDEKEKGSVQIPTLFVIGENDQVIVPVRSEALLPFFSKPQVIKHEGGHFVPATSKQKQAYLSFLDDQK